MPRQEPVRGKAKGRERAAEEKRRDTFGCEEAAAYLRRRVAGGEEWFSALLDAIALWHLPEEEDGERRYCYLIGGEAFDWLLLAERLTEHLDGAIPTEERETLLFSGQPPCEIDEDEFKRRIGKVKHSAHLNYYYGVTVEEALQTAVEEEVYKERRSHMAERREPVDEEVFRRIYGKGWSEMLALFREKRRLPAGDSISYSDLKDFTYWLFKYRVDNCDPARIASDTRKALLQLSKMEDCRRRRISPP
ncbi:MAG: hypothetical protein QME71_07685 [Dehalococcoidia bacterium]|nr:hypothetical protein [Dehalococcoidia bacterium]